MKKATNILSLLVIVTFLFSQTSYAEIIFSDNFNITDGGGDINYQIDAPGRQNGSVATLQYNAVGNTLVTNSGPTAGKLVAKGAPSCTFSPDQNFTDSGNFILEYEITRLGSGNWASVEFGHDGQNTAPWSPSGGMSIRFEENGSYVVQDGWPTATGQFNFAELSYASSPTLKVKIVVSQPGFPAIGDAKIALFVNDKPYPMFWIEDRASYVYKRPGFTNNYVSLLGFEIDLLYDNFKVSSPNSYYESKGWTNDADTSITNTKTYSHAVRLGTNGDVNVNGQIFTGAGTVITGSNWEIQYPYGFTPIPVDTFTAWGGNPNIDLNGRSLVQYIIYDWISDSGISISGLTPGLKYAFTLYVYGIGPVTARNAYFASNAGGSIDLQDMNSFGINGGQLLTYNYIAPESGILSISTTATNFAANAEWGWFAFSNELAPPDTPSSITASQGAYSDKINVSWTIPSGAESYTLYRGDTSNYVAAVEIVSAVTTNFYSDTTAAAANIYYYWVKACNAAGCGSVTGPAIGSTKSATPPDTPVNQSPATLEEVTSPVELTGSAYSGSAAFNASQWQVSQLEDFSDYNWNSGVTMPMTSLTVPGNVIAAETNYWRVRYEDEFSTWSDWSAGTSFILTSAPLNSATIFRDIFNVSGSGDVNRNYNSVGRQSGNSAPLTYKIEGTTEIGNSSIAPGWLTLNKNSGCSPNQGFIESGNFNIEFDIKPHNLDESADWASISFGKETQDSFSPSSDSGIGNLFYANGTFQTYSSDSLVGDATGLPTSEKYHVLISVGTEEFDNDEAAFSTFVNNQPMIVDSTTRAINNMPTYDYVKSSGFVDNYITLYNNGNSANQTLIDNFKISRAPNAVTPYQWTGDGDAIFAEPEAYTLAVNLNGDDLTIDDVTFRGTGFIPNIYVNGAPEMTKTNWVVTASGDAVAFFGGEPATNFVTGVSKDLANQFAFPHGSFGFHLYDLEPRSSNSFYVYTIGFDPEGAGRFGRFSSSYGGAITNIDMDSYDIGGGLIVQYDYIASEEGEFSLAISPVNWDPVSTNSPCFHVSAFANVQTGIPEPCLFIIYYLAFIIYWKKSVH